MWNCENIATTNTQFPIGNIGNWIWQHSHIGNIAAKPPLALVISIISYLHIFTFAYSASAADSDFVDLFDGHTLNGWKINGGSAEYRVEGGTVWHTRGKKTKGRGWVASNDELVAKVRDAKGGWNTVSTIAVGDRIVNRINGFETFDIVDPICEKTGKLGLQLHGGADNEMRFKDWEVMPVESWMLPYIQR